MNTNSIWLSRLHWVVITFLFTTHLSFADSTSIHWVNDTLMVDIGHCPGEGCIYGTWVAHIEVPVFTAPMDSVMVGLIHPNDTFTALTGNNYFVPNMVVLTEDNECCAYNSDGCISAKRGDSVHVLTNIGEGHNKVFIHDVYGISDCWENENFSVWWVKIVTKDGLTGWIRFPDSGISGSDAFG